MRQTRKSYDALILHLETGAFQLLSEMRIKSGLFPVERRILAGHSDFSEFLPA